MSTYNFAITPRVRWELGALFNIIGHAQGAAEARNSLKAVDEKRAFNRLRRALGLAGIMSMIGERSHYYGNKKLIFDTKTRHLVTLTDEQVDFLMKKIFPLALTGLSVAVLEEFIEAVDMAKTVKKVPPVPEGLSPVPDIEEWNDPIAEAADRCPRCKGTGLRVLGTEADEEGEDDGETDVA